MLRVRVWKVMSVGALHSQGFTGREISKVLGVSEVTVWRYVKIMRERKV